MRDYKYAPGQYVKNTTDSWAKIKRKRKVKKVVTLCLSLLFLTWFTLAYLMPTIAITLDITIPQNLISDLSLTNILGGR